MHLHQRENPKLSLTPPYPYSMSLHHLWQFPQSLPTLLLTGFVYLLNSGPGGCQTRALFQCNIRSPLYSLLLRQCLTKLSRWPWTYCDAQVGLGLMIFLPHLPRKLERIGLHLSVCVIWLLLSFYQCLFHSVKAALADRNVQASRRETSWTKKGANRNRRRLQEGNWGVYDHNMLHS